MWRCVSLLLAASLCAAAPEGARRFILLIQFPYDQKVKLPLYRTGALERIEGQATVLRKKVTRLTVELENAPAPSSVKPEYKAFVLWAVERNGNPVNLGAIEKGASRIETPLQSFGLVVSLESDPQAPRPAGLFVLESHLPEKRTRYFGMEKVFYGPN